MPTACDLHHDMKGPVERSSNNTRGLHFLQTPLDYGEKGAETKGAFMRMLWVRHHQP